MEVTKTLIELGGLMLGLGVLATIAVRIGVSPIPLYLLGGLALGKGGVFRLHASEEIIALGAEIGVVLLLFTLGLEYNATELATSLRANAPMGAVDIILNATPGVLIGLLLGWNPLAVAALGGITYVTSSGITSKMLSDAGWLGNRETPTTLSLLVFEDLVMAVYLPILTALAVWNGWMDGITSLAISAAAIGVVLFIGLRYGRFVQTVLASPNDESLVLKVLGLTLLAAGISQELQVSAAVGAFLIGIALSGPIADAAHNLTSPLRHVFAAIFFVFFGLNTDAKDLLPVAGVVAILAVLGIVTKLLTGYLAARRAGIGRRGRARAGVMLTPRGEFSIVIAGLIATEAGAPDSIGAITAGYVLVLAIVGPLLVRLGGPLLSLKRRTGVKSAPISDSPRHGDLLRTGSEAHGVSVRIPR